VKRTPTFTPPQQQQRQEQQQQRQQQRQQQQQQRQQRQVCSYRKDLYVCVTVLELQVCICRPLQQQQV
jgi:hypothetical protein